MRQVARVPGPGATRDRGAQQVTGFVLPRGCRKARDAAALWGHYSIFGSNSRETSISIVIGTGNGGGIILDGNVVKGRMGFGGELGHVLIPYQSIAGTAGLKPECNCGRIGDLESVCSLTAIEKSLLPFFLPRYPGHELAKLGNLHQAAKLDCGIFAHQMAGP